MRTLDGSKDVRGARREPKDRAGLNDGSDEHGIIILAMVTTVCY